MSQIADLCRICLNGDIRLQTISDTSLQTVFEKINKTPLHTSDSRPIGACYICYAQLKRCLSLMNTCAKSEEMLTIMLQHNPKSNKFMTQMDYDRNSIRSLTITPVDCIDTYSFNAPISIKEEPQHVLDIIKQEIEFEESFDSPEDDLSPDQYNDRTELDLKDDDVLRSIKLEKECYSYKVKIEPLEEDVSTQQGKIQAKESELLVKRKRKHSKRHKRKHSEKHLRNDDGVSIKPEKLSQEYKSSNEIPKSKKEPKTSTVAKYFECDDCHYRFGRKCHLETHMAVHKDEKPFKCSFCQKRFKLKNSLDRHVYKHTGEKPERKYQCPVCQRKFVEKNVMKIHLRTHTGEQPYECDICEKRFKQRNDAKRHRRTHTGEKPFKCEICQRRFNERSKVTRHQKTHYGEKLTKRDLKKLFT